MLSALYRSLGTLQGRANGARTVKGCEEHLNAPADARCDSPDLFGECVLSSVQPASVPAMQLVHTHRPREGNEDVSARKFAHICAGGELEGERWRREMLLPRTHCWLSRALSHMHLAAHALPAPPAPACPALHSHPLFDLSSPAAASANRAMLIYSKSFMCIRCIYNIPYRF